MKKKIDKNKDKAQGHGRTLGKTGKDEKQDRKGVMHIQNFFSLRQCRLVYF